MQAEIGGRAVPDPVGVVARFIEKHEDAIRHYDLFDQEDPNRISPRDVLATKHIDARIDGSQLQFFMDRGRKAPWVNVPVGLTLAEADPGEEGGVYDDALEFYRHFYRNRQRGLSSAKIHKVLYLKRRALIPLLDGRLQSIYDEQSKEMSKRFREVRRGRRGRLFWAAIREDILRNEGLWDTIRRELGKEDEPVSLATQLTDVRLHDILAWELVPRRR